MKTQITPHFTDLLFDALLNSFWRKKALARFLRATGISETFISTLQTETKRELIEHLFERLEKHPSRSSVLLRMAHALVEQKTFPDLEGWEDSTTMITRAKRSVNGLKKFLEEQERANESIKEKERARKLHLEHQTSVKRTNQRLETLNEQLKALFPSLGTQQGGYEFQNWFYDFVAFYEISLRRPYVTGNRQIDGSITLSGTTYLVELKFTRTQTNSPDIDTFIRKVTTKADNTMGIFVSMSGFSSGALEEASRDRSPILLFDSSHIYHALSGTMSFTEIISRVRRHASQTSSAYLKSSDFDG